MGYTLSKRKIRLELHNAADLEEDRQIVSSVYNRTIPLKNKQTHRNLFEQPLYASCTREQPPSEAYDIREARPVQ
jgi:hypothetical protein